MGIFKVGLKCDNWLLVRDKVGNIRKYTRNATDLGLAVICMENVPGTICA